MQITSIDFTLHRVSPSTTWQDATHRVSGLEFIVARLRTDSGFEGVGLTYTVGVGGSAILALLEDYCASFVIGHDVRDIESLWLKLFNHLHRTGSGGINTLAIAAIDSAAWDAIAKSQNLPLWRVLGGARTSIRGYGSGIDLFMSPDELVAHVQRYLDAGYTTVKIKVGRPRLSDDVERIKVVRELIGEDRALLLDANQCWDASEAVQRARAFEPFMPSWLEEPIAPEDVAGHARLRRSTSVPIAMGESLYTLSQFAEYVRADAVDVLQPDVARVGGFTPWRKIAALAEAWNLKVAPHFLLELSVHAICGVTNGMTLENVTGGSLADLGLIDVPLELRDGAFVAPTSPGIGLSLNAVKLEQTRVRPGMLRELDTSTHL